MPAHKLVFALTLSTIPIVAACNAAGEVVGTVATLSVGAIAVGHDIAQTYYVGVLDPHEQLPPALYRITVRGQSSAVNSVKFASGWVDARLVDSLETSLRFDDEGQVELGDAQGKAKLETGRAMWLFGPEGFRKAPRDHRLVIVMGNDPGAFFEAVDNVLGELDLARNWERDSSAGGAALRVLELVDRQQRATGSLTFTGKPAGAGQ